MRRRKLANRILAAVFLLFAAAAAFKYCYPGELAAELLFMVSEAALVGGVADWFAVTALFRRPLGFPWHTELIPRNRVRLIRSIVSMVEQDLLSAEAIKNRIAGICFMSMFIDWVENKKGRAAAGSFAAKAAVHVLENIDAEAVARRLERIAQRHLRDAVTLPDLENTGQWLSGHGRAEQLFVFMLDELCYVIRKQTTYEAIYQYLDSVMEKKAKNAAARIVLWLGEHTNSINTKDAALALQVELLELMGELREPRHPIHEWAVANITANVNAFVGGGTLRQAAADWADTFLHQLSLDDLCKRIISAAIDSLRRWAASGGEEARRAYPPLMLWVFDQAAAYWDSFKEDPDIHYWVEQYVKKALFRLVETEHHLIGSIVEEALQEFDDKALNDFVEDKAGEDLQWIRINGSVVGAVVGLLLFLFLRFLYDPVFVPLIRSCVL